MILKTIEKNTGGKRSAEFESYFVRFLLFKNLLFILAYMLDNFKMLHVDKNLMWYSGSYRGHKTSVSGKNLNETKVRKKSRSFVFFPHTVRTEFFGNSRTPATMLFIGSSVARRV